MKLLKLITSYLGGFVISIWIIILWLLLVNPYNDVVNSIISVLPENIQIFIDSDKGFTLLQILFLVTIFVILLYFYKQGYKDAKEKFDVTKNINESNNN